MACKKKENVAMTVATCLAGHQEVNHTHRLYPRSYRGDRPVFAIHLLRQALVIRFTEIDDKNTSASCNVYSKEVMVIA